MPQETPPVRLTLRADQTLEHPLVDALLTYAPPVAFQVQAVKSFHAHQDLKSIRDQVAGHQPQILVNVETTESDWSALLQHLKHAVSHADIAYAVTPIIAQGSLSTLSPHDH
jgi:hypothetical protein